MSRRAVVLRHVAFEDLGLLAPILDSEGWQVSYREASFQDLTEPAIASADLLVVLGGPIGVYEEASYPFLVREIALFERRLKAGLPTLGICLGAQLMAKALGARVYPGGTKEIGWGHVTPTEAGRSSCLAPLGEPDAVVLHWHGDTFDLPHGATRLVSNENYENQAFSHGAAALALQFHLEADPARLEEWYVGHTGELAQTRISVPDLRAATASVAGNVRPQAERIFRTWLRTVDPSARAAE